jgi:hypothetical protein
MSTLSYLALVAGVILGSLSNAYTGRTEFGRGQEGQQERFDIYKACNDSLSFEREILHCAQNARNDRQIDVCQKAFTFQSDKERCLTLRARPSLVKACAAAFSFSTDKFECILLRPTPEQVSFCVKSSTFESDKMMCLRRVRID